MTTMDAIAKGWLVSVCADHYWRVAHWYEFDDLLQDGHMIWWLIVQRYETEKGRVRSRPHLMRLFKTSFMRHIHMLSNRKTANVPEELVEDVMARGAFVYADSDGEIWDPWGMIDYSRDLGDMDRFVLEAPNMLRELLSKILYEKPSRAMTTLSRFHLDGTRDTLNKKLCRVLGVDPLVHDLAAQLYAYLNGLKDSSAWRSPLV